MGRQIHSRESIIQTLRTLAQRLQKETLTLTDLHGTISPSIIKGHFGTFGNALESAGLRRNAAGDNLTNRGMKYSDVELFRALLDLERSLGHEPRYNEFTADGKMPVGPFRKRFGSWDDTLACYRKWKAECGPIVTNEPPVALPASAATSQSSFERATTVMIATATNKAPTQFYGEPIDFRGLRHAPINEQGVVYLFGMVSRELGFYIEAVQQGFPDCEGKFLYDSKRSLWAKARIEFEFRASNFREQGHDPSQCDFIVCWENDWPDCPINVIELRKEILKLPSRS